MQPRFFHAPPKIWLTLWQDVQLYGHVASNSWLARGLAPAVGNGQMSAQAKFLGKKWLASLAALPAFAVLSVPALADVRAGVEAYEAGDYARAIREWRPLAIAGDADAQFNMGQAYKLGRGVTQDLPQAIEWFRRAAAQGHVQAEDNLGLMMYETGNRVGALPLLERSAQRGEPRAQFVLGAELFNGENVTRDWVRAYALMKRAADAGLQRASSALAQMDQHIPLEQRRAALAMADQMAQSEGQARIAALTAGQRPAPARASTIRPAPLEPSAPGTTYIPPANLANPSVAPAPAPMPDRPAPAPAAVRVAAPTGQGNFMVQLGAFGNESGARTLWSRLNGRLSGATPRYVPAGRVVRLQAGPYASRSAAESACQAIRPQACFVVTR